MTGVRRPAPAPRRVRTPLTIVDTVSQERTDVIVELEDTTSALALESAVEEALHPRRGGLWLGGAALEGTVARAGLRAGSVLGLGGPAGDPVVDSRTGPAVQVVSGAEAGAVHALGRETRLGDVLLSTGPAGVVAIPRGGPAAVLRPCEALDVGDRQVRLCAAPVEALLGAGLETEVTRPPRLRASPSTATLRVPEEPAPLPARRLPVVPLLLPVLLGVVLAVLSNPVFLLFTLLSPLMALSTWWSDRGQARRVARERATTFAREQAGFAAEQSRLRAAETAARHEAAPDPAVVLVTASGPGPRLWERRRSDDDALLLRVGTGSQEPRSYRLSSGAPAPLAGVPVTVPLRDVGVLGVTGTPGRSLARWLVAQAAALHSPRDLSVWLLVDPAGEPSDADWGWLRWLPHSAPAVAQQCAVLVGNTIESLTARVAELTSLVAARTAGSRDVRAQLHARQLPDLLVVLDGARALRSLAGLPAVLRDGPAVGVHVVCLEERERLLPEECQAVVSLDGEPTVRLQGGEPMGVRPDLPTRDWAEQVARALAPLRDAGHDGEAEIPSAARLLDALQLDPPTAAGVRARWGRTTAAVVGLDADGPVALDLRRDGPHVLVAGTTGSGKSELLQTLVASLAVTNRPDAMTFVLVDYKGGAAFKDCARLPHTVGMVTDLDGHLVERALASLTAELRRREQLLAAAGAKDIEDLWATGAVLARLVIVIDEFASLVEELPDFVRGLVGIAQRGRSLGVHLVLATQRPSGVVSPEIRANTNLRLALRVTDAAESLDVLDAPDAAGIPRSAPGRAFARTGHSTLFAFQTARVGGRRPGAATERLEVVELPWHSVGLPLPAGPGGEPEAEATDLHALVEAVREAAAGLPAPGSPWLPPLPATLALEPLDRPGPLVLPFGLEDVPAEQRRQTAALDLVRGGHLLVAGAARSGRTTLLRALAASLAAGTSPDDVQVYALDCGNGSLLGLADLPHTGAVVTRTQPDRAERLLSRLAAEVTRRQELFAAAGWADLAEQRASADPLPYLLLLVDRWEGFSAAFDDVDAGRLPEALLHLVREGLSAGLRVVVTGDRTALLGKLSQAIEDTLVLRLAERSDYALAGLSPRQLPDVVGDGRAFRAGTGHEVQVGLLTDDPSGAAQAAALTELARGLPSPAVPPFRVDPLPTRVTWAEAAALPCEGVGIGVGGDELALLGVDLAQHGPGFTVAGPPRSGRSTALVGLASGLLAAGTRVCALTPRPSPLRHVAGVTQVEDADGLVRFLNAAPGGLVVVADDADLLVGSPVADVLAQVLRDGRDAGHALVVAGAVDELGASFRGFAAEVRKSRSGLLLGLTNHLDGELLGVRLPRSAVGAGPVGRGLLV
ncbi:MAG: putative cell division FtsK/SpoIIIE-like protein, partial [Frankiales bacterium]|nr:putative cell division FtsK/SpoIIIE-like protein [Frankiales bacterium]